MAFTVRDYQDLVRLLDQHPEWQAELRRLLLADDFLALPAIVRDLAEAQRRTETRLEQLAEAQQRTEARLEQLAEAQRQRAKHAWQRWLKTSGCWPGRFKCWRMGKNDSWIPWVT